MTPEARTTVQIIRYLKALRAAGEPVWHVKLYGGTAMQRAGLPDLVVIYRSKVFWIEIKAPKGRVSRIQEHTIGRIQAAGGLAAVVRSLDEVREILTCNKNDEHGTQMR